MPTVERIKVELPQELIEHYEAMATLAGCQSVEEFISQHLEFSKHWQAEGIHLTEAESKALRRMLGSQVGSKKSLVEMIKKLVTITVAGHKVEVPIDLMEQLHYWAKSSGRAPSEYVPELIIAAIREKVQSI